MTRLPRALLPVLVGVLAFVAFLPALDGEFLDWDDDRNFLWNTGYRGLGLRELQWMFTATWMGHYIPITWLSFGLNHALGGMEPWGYHLGNLLLHAANTALVFFVARRLLAVAAIAPASHGNPERESGGDQTRGRKAARPSAWPPPPPPCCGPFTPFAWSRSRGSRSGETCSAASSICSRCSPTFGGRPGSAPSPGDGSRHLSRPSRRPSARKPSR